MSLRFEQVILALIFVPLTTFAKTHILKKGDTLANVARAYYGEPVFGPKGTIKKIYKLNPWALSNPNLVEPGQSVQIDDESASAFPAPVVVTEPVAPQVIPEKEAVVLPPIEPMQKVELVVAPEPTPVPAPPVEAVKVVEPVASPEPSAATSPAVTTTKPKSYFSIVPFFTTSKISTSTDPSAFSYDLSSNSTYGIRLGWDHWWTKSFSTIANYSLSQLKSTSTNDTTTETFANSVNVNSAEFMLLNRVGGITRLGLGAAYGTHLFVEGFASTPANQSLYNVTFWNPFLMTEVTLRSTEKMDLLFNLKIAPMPADVGHDHDLKTGMEYTARITAIQKFENSAFSLGLSYLQNDQSRIGNSQTQKDTTFEIGYLF